MFRRMLNVSRLSALPLTAAAITININDVKPYTNKELSSKPKWYIDSVLKLEAIIKKMSLYQPNESASLLSEAIDTLRRFEDIDNMEISWRLGRALIEEADWVPTTNLHIGRKISLLEEAIGSLKKALSYPESQKCAGVNKWYAIALKRLVVLQKKNELVRNADSEITQRFQSSIAIDPKDPYVHLELDYYLQKKNYGEALKHSTAANKLKPDFSNFNNYILGVSLYYGGNKDEGIKCLKKAASIKPDSLFSHKGWYQAKQFLISKAKLPREEVDSLTWEY